MLFLKEENKRYAVETRWGWFSLDEASYTDYLAGKLWISWDPARKTEEKPVASYVPTKVSAEAVRLRDAAEKQGVYPLLQDRFPGARVEIPCLKRMDQLSIDELCLSVRASNGLMRAGAFTFGKLRELMNRENGLKAVRNLGVKSEKEIMTNFLTACYTHLSPGERAQFWQDVLDARKTDI